MPRLAQNVGALGALTADEVEPGLEYKGEKLKSWVRKYRLHNSHWCGSAAMGDDPNTSVVDAQLRVRGN